MAYRVQYQVLVEPVPVPATAAAPSVAAWAPQTCDPVRRPFAVALIVAGTVLPVFTGAETVSADRWRGSYPDVPPPPRRVALTGQSVLPAFAGPETVTVDRWQGSAPAILPAPRRPAPASLTVSPVLVPTPWDWAAQHPASPTSPRIVQVGQSVRPVYFAPETVTADRWLGTYPALAPAARRLTDAPATFAPVAVVTPTGWLAQQPGPVRPIAVAVPGATTGPVFVPTPWDWQSRYPALAPRAFPAHAPTQGLSAPVFVPPAVLPPLGWLMQLPDLAARARGVVPGGASFVYAPAPATTPALRVALVAAPGVTYFVLTTAPT